MNAANNAANYLKSNNRYVSSNKQVPSPQGPWRHWIIIRGAEQTLAFLWLWFSVCFPVVPSGSAEVECLLHLHPHLVKPLFLFTVEVTNGRC